ncbi:CG33111, partial [Drosophila busckii]
MERRGRIPVAKFRTQEAKTRSRSRVREPDYNEQDPEHDMFTLLEDNIALKEENKALKLEIESHKSNQEEQHAQHDKLCAELEALQQRQLSFEVNIKELTTKFNKMLNERNALDKLHKMKVDQIQNLSSELENLRAKQQDNNSSGSNTLIATAELKRNLFKILQQGSVDSAHSVNATASQELDSLVDVEGTAGGMVITSSLVESLVAEFQALKQTTNAVELQLYEANEKIAELVEHQHLLEEENETLRTENGNLTKVAKLLTENMKESVETSQKMEAALIKLKQRNEELTARAMRDLPDGQSEATPSPTALQSQVDFDEIKDQVQQQAREHNERIVEMQSLMDAAIAKTTNDELKKLQLKLEILEEQLRQALTRAEVAEEQLSHYQHEKQPATKTEAAAAPAPPPPPPPPMPEKLLHTAPAAWAEDGSFSQHIAKHNLHKNTSDKIIDNVKQQVEAQAATGLDAIVREFKSGRVTLRRNRRRTGTSEALQEMFQVLEISQKQNRNSKICVDMNA